MRIRRIKIGRWRHFKDIEFDIGDDEGLVCVVGANGTGKSHLLELISACAHRLGLSTGAEIPRGDPFSDLHDFSLLLYLAEGASDSIESLISNDTRFDEWDRSLELHGRSTGDGRTSFIQAGGISDPATSQKVGQLVANTLHQSRDVHFLSLDADRAYPKKNVNIHEIAQAYEIDWDGPEFTRGRSFRPSTTLYDEWIKYFLAQENQAGTRLIQATRRARQGGVDDPIFNDHFFEYKEALTKVLPHLIFTGVNPKQRTLVFDTTGMELSFDQLSGGEREIAFLTGQIDRFGLRHGLFLLDEPELHLNADLIRSWVQFLTNTVQTGQVWLATHSLEAVEAAGQNATFVLERNKVTRQVDSVFRLDTKPILAALSRAVGTPAFAIFDLIFVFIEGEDGIGERERFRRLSGSLENVRFLECGSCSEVIRRVDSIKRLAIETTTEIRVAGVIDRDFRSVAEIDRLKEQGIHVLAVHEVENFFLHPESISILMAQNGVNDVDSSKVVLEESDKRAGSWIFQHAMATRNAESIPKLPYQVRDYAKSLSWSDVAENEVEHIDQLVRLAELETDIGDRLRKILSISTKAYAGRREDEGLWKYCEGKQVLPAVARAAGFRGPVELTSALLVAWEREVASLPDELAELRGHLASINANTKSAD